jgi:hypothetical protein
MAKTSAAAVTKGDTASSIPPLTTDHDRRSDELA